MKKNFTLLISAMFFFAIFSSCNGDNGDTTPAIPVSGVTLKLGDETSLTLAVGGEMSLWATILPWDATNRTITWYSSNADVATVTTTEGNPTSGQILAVAEGATSIAVTTQDGNHTATFPITVLPGKRTCNFNTPGWGESLGTVSWGTIGNTDIESGTTTIIGTDGRYDQVWSGAVFASACQDRTTFVSMANNSGNFNADCRRAHTELTGHFFSWCAVVRFADVLCPYPWRVPSYEDFIDLDMNLGGTGQSRSWDDDEELQWYTSVTGTGYAPEIGGIWDGARFTGTSRNPTSSRSYYWSSTESSSGFAHKLGYSLNHINIPRGGFSQVIDKSSGFALRCVR